jgi:hypothetical protein
MKARAQADLRRRVQALARALFVVLESADDRQLGVGGEVEMRLSESSSI